VTRLSFTVRQLIVPILLAAAVPGGAAVADDSADALIKAHVDARGGAAAIAAVQSLERHGHLVIPGMSLHLDLAEWQSRGGRFRQDMTMQGLTATDATDGRDGWAVSPFEGRKDPSRLSEDEIKDLRLKADFEFPFVDYRAKGHRVSRGPQQDVDGTPADTLAVHLADGNEATYWIDPDTHMVIRALIRETIRGAEDVTEIDYGEYQQVAGVWMPMTEEIGAKGSDPARRQKLVFDRAEANTSLPATLYTYPVAPTAGSHP
jgi:hypothetical protein